jgi:hypothetical protein
LSERYRREFKTAGWEFGAGVSVYHAANGIKFWIITEADRSITTVLLPQDY